MSRPIPRRPAPASTAPQAPAAGSAAGFRIGRAATLALAALAAATLAAIALALLPVGAYFTESDFYGYAWGARLIERGQLDFARYSVVGPLYELVIAALWPLAHDAFRAAQLLSALAAGATLLAWAGIVRRLMTAAGHEREAAAAGFGTALFVAVNPVFVRYGCSATTDMLAVALQSLAAFALLAGRGRRAPLVAGGLAALAALTRYSSLYLVPAALLRYALWPVESAVGDPRPWPRRLAPMLQFLAGFAVPALPWLALSAASGHLPGANLIASFSYYADPSAARNLQDAAPGAPVTGYRSLGELLRSAPGALAARVLANLPDHLARQVRGLIGLPAAAACALGLLLGVASGAWRRLLPAWIAGALLFATLAPVFYSDRYALPLVPFYLSLAGLAAGIALRGPRLPGIGLPLAWLALAVPVALGARAAVEQQRWLASQLPVEVVTAGETLHRAAGLADPPPARGPGRSGPASGVGAMSRKMHLWYYSGLDPVAFPRVATLAALADQARASGARFLYFSWYEAELRPEFWYLLDSTATVPGLERLPFAARNPVALYRLGPGFGRDPDWLADARARGLHVARAQVQVLNEHDAWNAHLTIAEDARARGAMAEALEHYLAATRGNPGLALAWQRAGEALLALGRVEEARGAYERARRLLPGDAATLIGIGWTQLRSGRADLAAQTWRPLVGATTDAATLRAMAEAFERAGDAEGLAAARKRLAEVRR